MGLVRDLIHSLLDEVKPKAPRKDDDLETGGHEGGVRGPNPAAWAEEAKPQQEMPEKQGAGAPAVPPTGQHEQRRREREEQRRARKEEDEDSDDGHPGKYAAFFQIATSTDRRRTHSLWVTHMFAYSIIIVGIIFLVLTCTGNFPTSVANQKALGVFTDNIVKYSLYIFSGVAGVAAVLLAKAHLMSGKALGLPMAALVIVELSLLATIGMSIYVLTVNSYYSAWWSWLLAALMLVQRVLYLLATFAALITLREASRDVTVRKQMEAMY